MRSWCHPVHVTEWKPSDCILGISDRGLDTWLCALSDGALFAEAYGGGPPRCWRSTVGAAVAAISPHHWPISMHWRWICPGLGPHRPPKRYSVRRGYARLVAPVLDAFEAPPVVIGHSFGGRIAVCLAAAHPDRVGTLIISGAPLVGLTPGRKPSATYRLLRFLNQVRLIGDVRMEEIRRSRGSADYRAATGGMREILVKVVNESYEEELGAVRSRVIMLWGADDGEVPVEVAERSLRIIRQAGGSAELEVLPGDRPSAPDAGAGGHLSCPGRGATELIGSPRRVPPGLDPGGAALAARGPTRALPRRFGGDVRRPMVDVRAHQQRPPGADGRGSRRVLVEHMVGVSRPGGPAWPDRLVDPWPDIPLAWTARLRRAGIVAGILLLGVLAGAVLESAFFVALGLFLLPALIDIALLVLGPIERILGNRWVQQASARLQSSGAKVVAITGSYGKTSTKQYAAHLLAGTFRTMASPASFNNRMGLARAINEHLVPGMRSSSPRWGPTVQGRSRAHSMDRARCCGHGRHRTGSPRALPDPGADRGRQVRDPRPGWDRCHLGRPSSFAGLALERKETMDVITVSVRCGCPRDGRRRSHPGRWGGTRAGSCRGLSSESGSCHRDRDGSRRRARATWLRGRTGYPAPEHARHCPARNGASP